MLHDVNTEAITGLITALKHNLDILADGRPVTANDVESLLLSTLDSLRLGVVVEVVRHG